MSAETAEINVAEEQKLNTEIATAIQTRFKGAKWFPHLYEKDVMILGQGGIGSWLSLLLSRIGCKLHIYDMDKFESHNGGQVMRIQDIGKLKTVAITEIVKEFSPDTVVKRYGQYTVDSETADIVLCGFDNMKARKIAFQNWSEYVTSLTPAEQAKRVFMDGRLLAESMQIFIVKGDSPDDFKKYTTFLYDDKEIEEADCTFKQTTHCAAMIASKMVGYLTNWVSAKFVGEFRVVPFYHEYITAVNYVKNE